MNTIQIINIENNELLIEEASDQISLITPLMGIARGGEFMIDGTNYAPKKYDLDTKKHLLIMYVKETSDYI